MTRAEAIIADAVLDAWMTAEMIQEMIEADSDTQRPMILIKCLVDQLRRIRYDLTGEEERPRQLGLDHVAETRWWNLPERHRIGQEARIDGPHADAGVVAEQLDTAEPCVDLVGAGPDGLFVADVELDADGRTANFSRDRSCSVLAPAGDGDVRARGGEGSRHRSAEPARCAADDRTNTTEIRQYRALAARRRLGVNPL